MVDPIEGGLHPVDGASFDHVYIHNLLDDSEENIYFKDLQSRFVRVSAGCARVHRRSQAEMLGLTDHDLFGVEHADKARADEVRVMATGEPILDLEEREIWLDREDTWVSTSKFPLRDADGTIIGTFGISRDTTARVRAEQERARAAETVRQAHDRSVRLEAQLRAVLDGSRDPILTYDADLRCRYLNPAAEAFLGRPAEQVHGRSDREVGEPEDWLLTWEEALRGVLDEARPRLVEVQRQHGGEQRWYQASLTPDVDAESGMVGVQAALREITEMKRAGQELAHQATHCSLTGLANRYLLLDRAERALARLERRPATVVVLFVDLDGFKPVNDTYGHSAGDQLLIEVARRLTDAGRRTDTTARLGGDEFVLLCDSTDGDEYAGRIAGRVVESLSAPYALAATTASSDEPVQVRISASVGVAFTREPTVTAERLLCLADAAMYRAKEAGGNAFRFTAQLLG